MKKQLLNLKPGQKFRYKRKLYLVDQVYCIVNIFTGKTGFMSLETLITPVKVSIRVK